MSILRDFFCIFNNLSQVEKLREYQRGILERFRFDFRTIKLEN